MTKTITVLGTGIMGSGMARNLVKAGFDVTVWNRHREKAEPLAEDGVKVAPDLASAVSSADIVLTMLFDGDAVEEVMEEALPRMRSEAVWIQSSTVGLASAARLTERAGRQGIAQVDAPVLGTRQPAEAGTLTVLAAGPEEQRETVEPVFDAVGSRTIWVGDMPGDGQRLKLVANSFVLSLVGSTAQALDLTRRLGLDPKLFLDTIAGGPLDIPYVQMKGKSMVAGEFPPAFPLAGATKDGYLILEAMEHAGSRTEIMQALVGRYQEAVDGEHGAEDLAAVITAFGS